MPVLSRVVFCTLIAFAGDAASPAAASANRP
jgi:hypothetical protein